MAALASENRLARTGIQFVDSERIRTIELEKHYEKEANPGVGRGGRTFAATICGLHVRNGKPAEHEVLRLDALHTGESESRLLQDDECSQSAEHGADYTGLAASTGNLGNPLRRNVYKF